MQEGNIFDSFKSPELTRRSTIGGPAAKNSAYTDNFEVKRLQLQVEELQQKIINLDDDKLMIEMKLQE